jgi:hypothetical protein
MLLQQSSSSEPLPDQLHAIVKSHDGTELAAYTSPDFLYVSILQGLSVGSTIP